MPNKFTYFIYEPSFPAIQTEPPLQSKKRVISSDRLASQSADQEEYAILGKHEKFASNIKYRSKSVPREPPLAKTYKVHGFDILL